MKKRGGRILYRIGKLALVAKDGRNDQPGRDRVSNVGALVARRFYTRGRLSQWHTDFTDCENGPLMLIMCRTRRRSSGCTSQYKHSRWSPNNKYTLTSLGCSLQHRRPPVDLPLSHMFV